MQDTGCLSLKGDSDNEPFRPWTLLEVFWAPRKWLEGNLNLTMGVHSYVADTVASDLEAAYSGWVLTFPGKIRPLTVSSEVWS